MDDDVRLTAVTEPESRGVEPLDLLALVALFGAMVVVIGPIDDVNDVFWHVLIGREILDGVPFAELGSTFSASVTNSEWRTGAWGSEVIMAALHHLGGWAALTLVIRLGSILTVALLLWWGLLRRYPSRASVAPFVLAMAVLAVAVQERPQSISFAFITLASIWWLRSVEYGFPPPWWLVGLVAIVWANLHGLWVILPGVLALALIGRLLDHGRRDKTAKQLLWAIAAAALGGLVSPLGVGGWLLPFKLQDAGGIIVEWQRTTLLAGVGFLLLATGVPVLLLLGRAWRRSWGIYGLTILCFGLSAVRNVAPAVLLLAPLLTVLLNEWLGSRAITQVSRVEHRRLLTVASVLTAVCSVALVLTAQERDHGPRDELPIEALEALEHDSSTPIRLLNEYNWSGVALFYGPQDLKVGVDGRADFYGGPFIRDYESSLSGNGLDELVNSLEPTHALLRPSTAATTILELQGWSVLRQGDDYVLMEAP